MPPRKRAAHRKSYRIADVFLVIVTVAAALSIAWGYGAAYQIGYDAGIGHAEEVRHG